MNDTTAPGYLAPLDGAPTYDTDLDKVFCRAVAGITAMADALVVAKGLPKPMLQPDRPETWCVVGVTEIPSETNPSVTHDGAADGCLGTSTYSRTETLSVMASFYGPQARGMASRLRDGLGVGQNRAMLRSQGIAYAGPERMTGLADLENQQFVRRCDLVLTFRRTVSRTYAIRNVVGLLGEVVIDAQSHSGTATIVDPLRTGI